MKKKTHKIIKAWAVLGTQNDKGGLRHEYGYPMIHIQRIKPIVCMDSDCTKKEKVVRINLIY